VYHQFTARIVEASGGPLERYIEVHQNSSEPNIEVDFRNFQYRAAQIKRAYTEIHERVLRDLPQFPKVDLRIEPVDQVAIGAWATKDHGILQLAKSSLHFELPAQFVFHGNSSRREYTKILAELIDFIVEEGSETETVGEALSIPSK